jgi:hypothetical protein
MHLQRGDAEKLRKTRRTHFGDGLDGSACLSWEKGEGKPKAEEAEKKAGEGRLRSWPSCARIHERSLVPLLADYDDVETVG